MKILMKIKQALLETGEIIYLQRNVYELAKPKYRYKDHFIF